MEYTFWQTVDTSKVVIFGISVGENDQIAQQFVDNFGLTYPVLRDPAQVVYFSYPVSGISPYPRDCIIDQQGIVRYLRAEYDPQYMRGVIEQLTQTTGISGENSFTGKPQKLDLRLFPNPTNSRSVITYTVAVNSPVTIRLFDARGREVLNEIFTGNDAGEVVQYNLDLSEFSSGIYFVRVENGPYREVQKLMLVQ